MVDLPGPASAAALRRRTVPGISGIEVLQRAVGNRVAAELVSPGDAPPAPELQRTVYHSGVGDLTYRADYVGWPRDDDAFVADLGRIRYAKSAGILKAIRGHLDNEPDRARAFAAIKVIADNQADNPVFSEAEVQKKVLDAYYSGPAGRYGVEPAAEREYTQSVLGRADWFGPAVARELGPLGDDAGRHVAALSGRERSPEAGSDDPLDVKRMQSDLPPRLTKVLEDHDPGRFDTVAQPLDVTMRDKSALVQQKAATYFGTAGFAAYAWNGRSVVHGSWSYPGNVEELGTADVSDSRLPFLENRARLSEVGVLDGVNFSDSRPEDQTALSETLREMLGVKTLADMVDRHLRNTPRRSGGKVWLQATHQKVGEGSAALARAQWETIRSMCHELLHVMSHPDFDAAANRIEDSQVVAEGFVEVLGVDLYNWILRVAAADAELAKALTGGLATTVLPGEVSRGGLGYGEAAAKAAAILDEVGGERFEAAFMLGRPELAGLPGKG